MKAIKFIIALALLAACTDNREPDTPIAIEITASEIADTRAAKTLFEPGDVITLTGDIAAEFTLDNHGRWVLSQGANPALPTDATIQVTATHGNPATRPRTDLLRATAATDDGNITLGIGADGRPVWNIRLRFEHTRPVVDIKVQNTTADDLTSGVQSIKIGLSETAAPANTLEILSGEASDVFLEPDHSITRVEVVYRGITYAADLPAPVALEAGKRYTIHFTAAAKESRVDIRGADEPEWTTETPTIAGYDYAIYTLDDFKAWAEAVSPYNSDRRENLGKKVIQMADITWTGDLWMPVGNDFDPFTGVYNGNGYTITGLEIGNNGSFAGMFGSIEENALLADIHLRGASIAAVDADYVGLIAGRATDDTTISLCSITGRIEARANNGFIGGLIGINQGAHITRSYINAVIIGTPADGAAVGGLAGEHNGGAIMACGVNADINITAVDNEVVAGGLVGRLTGSNIYLSYTTGEVRAGGSAINRYAGGMVGQRTTLGHTSQSYSTANAYGTPNKTGSLAGEYTGAYTITSCHATGLANDMANQPVAGTTNNNVSTDPADRRTTIGAGSSSGYSGIRTAVTGADGTISAVTRSFYGSSVWASGNPPDIIYTRIIL